MHDQKNIKLIWFTDL